MSTLLNDLRYAIRTFLRTPGFTAVALLTLTLGIGANTAIFTIVNGVLLRALPFREPDRLMMVYERPPESNRPNVVNPWNFLEWRARNHVFERIAIILQIPMNLTGDGEPEQIKGMQVSADFFPILEAQPALGRTFRPDEDAPGIQQSAVISDSLWQRRFGSDPKVIGHRIEINSKSLTIIGVMPPGFRFPESPSEVWVPAALPLDRTGGRNYVVVARLKPGISREQAQAEMESIAAKLAEEWPANNAKWSALVMPLMEYAVGKSRTPLLILLAAVGFVLLIACANVANLLLMRATGRQREIAIRFALGAARRRVLRQLLVESVALSLVGGVLGLLAGHWAVTQMIAWIPKSIPLPRLNEISLDRTVLVFNLALSVLTGAVFGLVPAIQISSINVNEGLKQGGRSATPGGRWLRSSFVVAEVSMALILLVGAGLMMRSFWELEHVEPGFRPERVLTMRLLLAPSRPHKSEFVQNILERVRALPQVTAAGAIHLLPLSGSQSGTGYNRADRPAPPPAGMIGGGVSVITPGYFQAMGIAILAGRDFTDHDNADTPQVLILNERAARMFYPGEDPLGKKMMVSWGGKNPREIVGVVQNIHHDGLNFEPEPTIFLANMQNPHLFANLVVRTTADPLQLARAVENAVHSIDRNQPVADIRTMNAVVSASLSRPQFQSALLGAFAAVALILACIGIYGVISYSVTQKTREIGVRLALGAPQASVFGVVIRESLGLTALGVAGGWAGAAALTRYLTTLLYGVKPLDPIVFLGVAAILTAVALLACYMPARRAMRIDPMIALRYE